MRFLDFFKRRTQKPEPSRFEFLSAWKYETIEAPQDAYDGLNLAQLIDLHLSDGRIDLAADNSAWLVRYCFELANLYWGHGEIEKAEQYLNKTIERHDFLVDVCKTHNTHIGYYPGDGMALAASILLDRDCTQLDAKFYRAQEQPGRIFQVLRYCTNDAPFDLGAWQASEDDWIKRRLPKYVLAEDEVYRKALTGEYGSAGEMLAAHERMFKGRGKKSNADSSLLDGYQDNDLIVDYVFACVLKRIGWHGRYRHSWPNTDGYDSVPETHKVPDKFLGTLPAPIPTIAHETGIISDAREARRFIDYHLKGQEDEDGEPFPAERAQRTRSKVRGALRVLDWDGDPESLALMRDYKMDRILNSSRHVFLCDPLEGGLTDLGGLKAWTQIFSDFGLHESFIALTGSDYKPDYGDPQGAWHVYWKKDQKVYAVDREEWHDPERATKGAKPGLSVWPNYTSFVAWWVSQNLEE